MNQIDNAARVERVMVVGGGVAGIELATNLASRAKGKSRGTPFAVTLLDAGSAHIWKPIWLHGLPGLLSIVFGIAVSLQPGTGALPLIWLIGFFALLFGVMLVATALRLRSARAY